MLNRRTLRVKAMQMVYAYKQGINSNLNIAKQNIDEAFAPDLNSMEVQDPIKLQKQKKEALELFSKNYLNPSAKISEGTIPAINEAANKAIAFYHKENENEFLTAKKNMVQQAEKIHDWFILTMELLKEFGGMAAKERKIDASHFVNNLLIVAITENQQLESVSLKKNLNWKNEPDQIKEWYNSLVKKDEEYLDYISKSETTTEQDVEIVNHIARKVIFKADVIDKFFEEKDINWSEDKPIVRSLVLKSLKSITEENKSLTLAELSYNWEEDSEFFTDLFGFTVKLDQKYGQLIASRAKNWDIDRLAVTDRVIIEMAMAEMIHFKSIPVKVTINEYIELAKKYSTPKSKIFINGILDAISEDLKTEGEIKKTGRGLLDNK